MAELTSLARPYARAAFESARDNNQLDAWSEALNLLASVTADPDMIRVLKHPGLTATQKVEVISDVCEGRLSEQVRNFVTTMADNLRLTLLPAIAELYSQYRHEHEQSIEVCLTTAFELDAGQQDKLTEALARKLDRKISMKSRVDKSIIGGVVIEAGDLVIDASVRGKLAKLANSIST